MPIDIRVEDVDLAGFSDPAKQAVKKAGEDFLKRLIEEANRLESAQNLGTDPVEITKGMVADATLLQRRGIGGRSVPIGIKILRIASSILALSVGIMYDKTKLQEGTYLVAFVVVIGAAILVTTISTLKE